jgi:6-phosphogluconolactonase
LIEKQEFMQLHVYDSLDAMSTALAAWISDYIGASLQRKDRFTIALSGGNTPKQLHHLLSASPYKEAIAWSKLHIFWGDERSVPFEDERNNAKMAFDTLLNHVPVPAAQIHVMRTDISPAQSAAEYEKILHRYFPEAATESRGNTFDLVLLGMGDDGHTLSLFPGTTVVHEEKAWVTSFYLPAQDMHRITLTKAVVNQSAAIVFLTTGSAKAHALKEVLKGPYNPDLFPSQVIKPVNGELHWFVDKAAAAEL